MNILRSLRSTLFPAIRPTRAAQDKALAYTLLSLLLLSITGLWIGGPMPTIAHGQEKAKAESGKVEKTDKPKPPVPPSPSPSPSVYVPTPDQVKDLRILQLEAINTNTLYVQHSQQLPEYQAWMMAAQKLPEFKEFQTAVGKIAAECRKIVAESKWPADVVCDVTQNPIPFSRGQSQAAAAVVPSQK